MSSVTIVQAQGAGSLLAPPVVHELRMTIPPLSQAILRSPVPTARGMWSSPLDAVTNVTIDVVLLPPDESGPEAQAIQVLDADGVLRRWSDGPVVVARALPPGRHNLFVRLTATGLTNDAMIRLTAGIRTFTRPALTVAHTNSGATGSGIGGPGDPISRGRVLLRIAP